MAVFDKGGWLVGGLTLVTNTTGQPERIIGQQGVADD